MSLCSPTDTLLHTFFEDHPQGAAYFLPVYKTEEPIDFLLERANRSARGWLWDAGPEEPEASLSSFSLWTQEAGLIAQMQHVLLTGEPVQAAHFFVAKQRWSRLTLSPAHGRLLIVFEELKEQPQAAELPRQVSDDSFSGVQNDQAMVCQAQIRAQTFDAVLETMLHSLIIFEVITDESGQLADLRYQYISQLLLQETGFTRTQLIGNTALTLFPGVRQSRLWTADGTRHG